MSKKVTGARGPGQGAGGQAPAGAVRAAGAGGDGPRTKASSRAVIASGTASRQPGAVALLAAAGAIIVIAFLVYAPALNGPFLFDDTFLPFALPGFAQPLMVWLRNVRPVLYLTYWINARMSGDNPYSYHVVHVLINCVTTG